MKIHSIAIITPLLAIIGLLVWFGSISVGASERKIDRISEHSVGIEIEDSNIFPDNRNVEIRFFVRNDSDFLHRMIYADGIYDLNLKLIGPTGERILGYHEMEGSRVGRGVHQKFSVAEIPPHQKIPGDSVPLSLYWPLENPGVYRCVFTKRIYRQDPAKPGYKHASEPGIPVEIMSPEFDFRIESIDPTFKSEAAKLINKTAPRKVFEEIPDKKLEARRTTWNIWLIGFIVVLVSYLGFSFWKRKS